MTAAAPEPSRFLADPRRERLWVAGVVLLAFAVRLVYVLEMRASPHFSAPIMDAEVHLRWARALLRGETFQEGPFFRAPLYPWFLAAVLRLTGGGLLAARVAQCVLGALTTLLVYSIGRRAFDRRAGLAAALGTATYWVLVYFDGELLIPTLLVPLVLLALWGTLGLADGPRPMRCLAVGAAWGLAAIARPNVLLFLPPLALWLAARARPAWGVAARRVAALAAGALLPILPITAYNAIVGGDAVLIASQAGVNFWIGNNPDSDGSTAIVPGTRGGWWQGYHEAIAMAEAEEGHALRPSEVSRHYGSKGWAWIAAHPADAARHFLRKLRLFWIDWELGNNQAIRFFALGFSRTARLLPIGFPLLAALGLLGAWLARDARRFPLWGFLLVYMASVVLFFVCSRFRVPVLPVLFVLGGHALVWMLDRWRERRFGPLLAAIGFCALVAAGTRALPAGLRTSDATGHLQLAAALQASDPDASLRHLERALELDGRDVTALTAYGARLAALGDPRAEEALQSALAIDPNRPDALALLLDSWIGQGRLDEAAARASAAIERQPHLGFLHFQLGRVLAARGELDAARARFAQAAQLDPSDFRAPYARAAAARRLGRTQEALEAYAAALERSHDAELGPAETVLDGFVSLLVERGERARACEIARAFGARRPESERARTLVAELCR